LDFILRWKNGNDITTMTLKQLLTPHPFSQNHLKTVICNSVVYNDEIYILCHIQNTSSRLENKQCPLPCYTNLAGVKSCKFWWSSFQKRMEKDLMTLKRSIWVAEAEWKTLLMEIWD